MKESIKKIAYRLGLDVCGIASINRFGHAPQGFSPLDIWDERKSVIAIGLCLPKGLTDIEPRLIYSHFLSVSYAALDEASLNFAKVLEKEYHCHVISLPCDNPYEYWDPKNQIGKGLLSMKHSAVLCGLGSLGKSSLLLNPEYGNMLSLGAVLTDLELVSDPLLTDLCIPGCTKCIDNCPAGALQSGKVNQQLCRQNAYGQTRRGFDTVNCNACRTACPLRFGKTNW